MNCCFSLCNPNNPHGCCHPASPLTLIWGVPFAVITCPFWCPIVSVGECCIGIKNIINDNIAWDESHKGYEPVDKI
jgi:hypothetical protein